MNPLDREKINLQREEIIEKIREWVKESGLSLEQIVKPGLENAPYAGKVQGKENLGYNVLFAEENKDFFFITTYFRFQEKDGKALFYLDPSDSKKVHTRDKNNPTSNESKLHISSSDQY